MHSWSGPFLAVLTSSLLTSAALAAEPGDDATRAPLSFVENRGQWPQAARFVARRGPLRAVVERDRLRLDLVSDSGRTAEVVLAFRGASEEVELVGVEPLPGRHHFLRGSDPARWHRNVGSYGAVRYRDLVEGVDVVLGELDGELKYDVLVDPGADLDRVVVECSGMRELRLAPDGTLIVRTAAGDLRQPPPVTWQVLPSGERSPVECRYRLIGEGSFGFFVEGRDPALPLVVDPALVWSTFLGGVEGDTGRTVALSADGTITVAGGTNSHIDFQVTPSEWASTSSLDYQGIFVSRLSPDASTLLWSTELGGSRDDFVFDIEVLDSGEVLVVGETGSLDFPTTPGSYSTASGGSTLAGDFESEGFVARLGSGGDDLVFSTFLGGQSVDRVLAVDVAANGAIVVAGETASFNFPTTAGAFDTSFNGGTVVIVGGVNLVAAAGDAFVSRLSADGRVLQFSTFLGGAVDEQIVDLSITAIGEIVVAGNTSSPDFPLTPGAFQSASDGGSTDGSFPTFTDGFVARVERDGSGLVYSTYLGGGQKDVVVAMALAPNEAPTVVGHTFGDETAASTFPTTHGSLQSTFQGGAQPFGLGLTIDGFVSQLTPDGQGLAFSTFLGGAEGGDFVEAVAVDSAGRIFVTGDTGATDFPTTAGAMDTSFNGGDLGFYSDVFAARLSAQGDALSYSTFLGGSLGDGGRALAIYPTGGMCVVGTTQSTDYPSDPSSYQPTHGGTGAVWQSTDAFLARLSLLPTGVEAFGSGTSGCVAPTAIGVDRMPVSGDPDFHLTCAGAPLHAGGFLLLGTAPDPLGSDLLGVALHVALSTSTVAIPVASDAAGFASIPVPLTAAPVGLRAFAQFVWVGPASCAAMPLGATGGLDIEVQP